MSLKPLTIMCLSAVLAVPTVVQAQKVEPDTKGPTGAITDQVPPMTGDRQANPALKSPPTMPPAPAERMATPPPPAVTGPTTAANSILMPVDEEKKWIGRAVYSSDQEKIGEVLSFKRGLDGNVVALNAGIGGFLGLGETKVMINAGQFQIVGDRIVANVLAADAKKLPPATE